MYSDKQKWEQRYRARGTQQLPPATFLTQWCHLLRSPVLDVAGGNGRNALFLARRGLRVHVVDIAHAALIDVARIAREQALPIITIAADLDCFPLARNHYGGLVVFHYLQRSLFDRLRAALRAGGVIIYETFLMEQQTVGHPRSPAHLLQRGELLTYFSDFEILFYDEGLLEHTPPAYLARLVARRPEHQMETMVACTRNE